MGKASREKHKRRELQGVFAPYEATHAKARQILIEKKFVPRYPQPAVPQVVGISVAAMEEVIAAGLTLLGEKPTPDTLIAFAEQTTMIHDRYADLGLYLYRDVNAAPVACKAGCNWCCYVRVSIGIEEAYRLSRAIETMDSEVRARLLGRVKSHVQATDDGDPESIVRAPRLCPMNEDGHCQVYGDRAVMCRNHVAYDVGPCRAFVEGNAEGMKKINGFLQEFGRYVTLGSIQVLEHYGIDSRSFEIGDIMQAFQEKPTLIDQVIEGDREATNPFFRDELERAHADFITGVMRKSQLVK